MADIAGPTNPANSQNKVKETLKRHHFPRTHFICASLFLTQLSLSLALFFASYRKFLTWYRTTHHLARTNDLIIHTTLFIATCAPLCSIIGVGVGAAYYWRKRLKYGKYDVKMRWKGRGYCIDPSDGEDRRLGDEALRMNMGIRRERERERERGERMRTEEEQQQQQRAGHVSFAVPREVAKKETKRVSFFSNPYEWVAKKDHDERIEGKSGGVGLERSDSVRTCESDETTRKGVVDIWLGRKGSKKCDDIEMITRR